MTIDIASPGVDEAALEAALRALMTRAHYGAKVRKSADQTAANYTSLTAVTWDAEDYDVGGWHDNVTNNTRLTVPSGVTRVDIEMKIEISLATAATRTQFQLYKNGSLLEGGYGGAHLQYNAATTQVMPLTIIDIPVVAGDYFECRINISADTSITIEGGADPAASFFKIVATR